MHVFEVLGDPVRRRIMELLAEGELSAGEVGAVVQQEFGISQPGVSQHLRTLRDTGFTTVRAVGTRRLYAVNPTPLKEADRWLSRYRRFWTQSLDALGDEMVRGQRDRDDKDLDEMGTSERTRLRHRAPQRREDP